MIFYIFTLILGICIIIRGIFDFIAWFFGDNVIIKMLIGFIEIALGTILFAQSTQYIQTIILDYGISQF